MSVWAKHRDSAKAAGGAGGLFFKLEDGASSTILVLGDPMRKWRIFADGSYQDVDPGTPSAQQIYVLNVFDVDEETTRIWDCNGPTFVELSDMLADLEEEAEKEKKEYDPCREKLQIKRNGTGPKTRYSIRPKGQAGAALMDAAGQADEYDLTEHGGHPMPMAADPADEDIPF